MNELMSPDYILFRNQVLRVGRLYTVTSGDTILRLADRFGTSHQSIAFLNYEVPTRPSEPSSERFSAVYATVWVVPASFCLSVAARDGQG